MSSDVERLLLATGSESGAGWASGQVCNGSHGFRLLDIQTPVGRLEPGACAENLTVVFSGVSQAEIPWGPESWEELTSAVKSVGSLPGLMAMRGHHAEVLADAPACLGWLDRAQRMGLEVGVALAPSSMLVPSMMATLEEHLERMFDYLGARAKVVIIEDLREEADELLGQIAGEGLLPGATLGGLIDQYVPRETPVIVHAASLESAQAWLWPNMT